MDASQRPSKYAVTRPSVEATQETITSLAELVTETTRPCFFALVGQLERVWRHHNAAATIEEFLRFRHDPALRFSSSDFAPPELDNAHAAPPLQPKQAPGRVELLTRFLGLTGATSPLPMYLVDEVATEDPFEGRRRDFLDIFHNRLLLLLYRLVARADYPLEFTSSADDRWSRRVLALTGHDAYGQANAGCVSDRRMLQLAPLLARRSRTARGMTRVLDTVLAPALGRASTSIEEFIGCWVTFDPAQRTRLGEANASLGVDMLLGSEMFERGGKFRVRVGLLGARNFRRFLPGGDALTQLVGVIDQLSGTSLAYDLELTLARGETPKLRLSSEPRAAARLGLDAWLDGARARETRVLVDPRAAGAT